MKFVEKHFTKHHLLHAPHKWFLAFLISPIHAGEMHYKKRYHMQFSHARKLFLFDMILLLSIAVIALSAVSWSMYHPKITNFMYLTITPSKDRVLSGEYMTYTIEYKNASEEKLTHAELALELPQGFIVDAVVPEDSFDSETNSFHIGNVEKKSTHTVSVSGLFYGTPNIEDRITVAVSYRQDRKTYTESKVSPHLIFLRGSILVSTVELPLQVVPGGSVPLQVTLKNQGDIALSDISIPFNQLGGFGTLENIITTKGSGTSGEWTIGELLPEEQVELKATIKVLDAIIGEKSVLDFTPTLQIRDRKIPQTTLSKNIVIAHPGVSLALRWEGESSALKPNETGRLSATITNTGNIELTDAVLEVPLAGSIVSLSEAARQNRGTIAQNTLILNSKNHTSLQSIQPGESRTVIILLPIVGSPDGGTDITLAPSVHVRAGVPFAPDVHVDASRSVGALKIGTQLSFSGEVRYYTKEGDQLGRGPLPPQVGKETKYAALFSIRNTTSEVRNVVFTAILPSYSVWTGKTSVTHGTSPRFDSRTRVVTWEIASLPPHATAGIFFELGITPTEVQLGSTPILISSAKATGEDTYLGYTLTRTLGAFDSSLSSDLIGRNKGTLVR